MAAVAIERLKDAAATAAPRSFEEQTLLTEAGRIEEMIRAVNVEAPDVRPELSSHLLAVSVRDPVQVSSELIEFVGAVADVYRRWRRLLRPAS
jgi:hypothetical protein